MMDLLTLTEIRRAASRTGGSAVPARVHVQVESATPKLTREQQPYCELTLADACDRMTLRVWSDHPAYKTCSALTGHEFIELTAEFHTHSQYGLEARKWTVRPLTDQEKNELLQGPADLRAKQWADWEFILQTMQMLGDPRLRALCDAFLNEWGERFRRAAAARKYHHARRGELVNSLWRKLSAENAEPWKIYSPPSEDVRLHLLHLIGSHHGQKELGSPVEPKTPEAMALHYIDNLDSKLEMFAGGYATAQPLAARIFDRVRPLPGNLVKSLEKFSPAPPRTDKLL